MSRPRDFLSELERQREEAVDLGDLSHRDDAAAVVGSPSRVERSVGRARPAEAHDHVRRGRPRDPELPPPQVRRRRWSSHRIQPDSSRRSARARASRPRADRRRLPARRSRPGFGHARRRVQDGRRGAAARGRSGRPRRPRGEPGPGGRAARRRPSRAPAGTSSARSNRTRRVARSSCSRSSRRSIRSSWQRRLDRLAPEVRPGARVPVLLQVNVDLDPAKHGFSPADVAPALGELAGPPERSRSRG